MNIYRIFRIFCNFTVFLCFILKANNKKMSIVDWIFENYPNSKEYMKPDDTESKLALEEFLEFANESNYSRTFKKYEDRGGEKYTNEEFHFHPNGTFHGFRSWHGTDSGTYYTYIGFYVITGSNIELNYFTFGYYKTIENKKGNRIMKLSDIENQNDFLDL